MLRFDVANMVEAEGHRDSKKSQTDTNLIIKPRLSLLLRGLYFLSATMLYYFFGPAFNA